MGIALRCLILLLLFAQAATAKPRSLGGAYAKDVECSELGFVLPKAPIYTEPLGRGALLDSFDEETSVWVCARTTSAKGKTWALVREIERPFVAWVEEEWLVTEENVFHPQEVPPEEFSEITGRGRGCFPARIARLTPFYWPNGAEKGKLSPGMQLSVCGQEREHFLSVMLRSTPIIHGLVDRNDVCYQAVASGDVSVTDGYTDRIVFEVASGAAIDVCGALHARKGSPGFLVADPEKPETVGFLSLGSVTNRYDKNYYAATHPFGGYKTCALGSASRQYAWETRCTEEFILTDGAISELSQKVPVGEVFAVLREHRGWYQLSLASAHYWVPASHFSTPRNLYDPSGGVTRRGEDPDEQQFDTLPRRPATATEKCLGDTTFAKLYEPVEFYGGDPDSGGVAGYAPARIPKGATIPVECALDTSRPEDNQCLLVGMGPLRTEYLGHNGWVVFKAGQATLLPVSPNQRHNWVQYEVKAFDYDEIALLDYPSADDLAEDEGGALVRVEAPSSQFAVAVGFRSYPLVDGDDSAWLRMSGRFNADHWWSPMIGIEVEQSRPREQVAGSAASTEIDGEPVTLPTESTPHRIWTPSVFLGLGFTLYEVDGFALRNHNAAGYRLPIDERRTGVYFRTSLEPMLRFGLLRLGATAFVEYDYLWAHEQQHQVALGGGLVLGFPLEVAYREAVALARDDGDDSTPSSASKLFEIGAGLSWESVFDDQHIGSGADAAMIMLIRPTRSFWALRFEGVFVKSIEGISSAQATRQRWAVGGRMGFDAAHKRGLWRFGGALVGGGLGWSDRIPRSETTLASRAFFPDIVAEARAYLDYCPGEKITLRVSTRGVLHNYYRDRQFRTVMGVGGGVALLFGF